MSAHRCCFDRDEVITTSCLQQAFMSESVPNLFLCLWRYHSHNCSNQMNRTLLLFRQNIRSNFGQDLVQP